MQFLERSVLGLRAARHRLESDSHAPRITLYPMIHVADPAFFAQVHEEALAHDLAITEGVKTKVTRNLTRAYRWLGVERLGLALQQPLPAGEGARELRADMTEETFDTLWSRLPRLERGVISLAAPVFGLLSRIGLTRARLIARMSTDDLTSRDDRMLASGWGSGVFRLLKDERDARLTEVLTRTLAEHRDTPLRIAVIYGAAHMPAVVRVLADQGGYRVRESDWLMAVKT